MPLGCESRPLARCRWIITGQVQGVGFRPFVYRLATSLGLSGFVRNDATGVVVECQADPDALEDFHRKLCEQMPSLAVVRSIRRTSLPVCFDSNTEHRPGFRIIDSCSAAAESSRHADVTVDAAICAQCLHDIRNRRDRRRYRYGLTNCTDCGPRFSIVVRIPYDRCNTTMAGFSMCSRCHAEYTDPADRRFHAQPIACHACGPRLELVDPTGQPMAGDPIRLARRMLVEGRILAIKGIGGFHLAVRADSRQAVARLRQLKHRDHKPFALMVRSVQAARELVHLSEEAVKMLTSPAAPIVLAPRRVPGDSVVADAVAPSQHRLGVMLPYTPIHHLLLRRLPMPLVMTSGNDSDEPLVISNSDAIRRLGRMCDAILWHDRPIQRGVDDSVVADVASGQPIFIRRARGFVPGAIELPAGDQDTNGICVGGELKNTIAVVRGRSAVLSQHLGDLSHPLALEAFDRAVEDFRHLFEIGDRVDWIAHDLHPAYLSTARAKNLAEVLNVPQVIPVQHHHAHAAALLAEHGIADRILAVVCDGTGYGSDGTIWGGEILAADLLDFERVAHLRPLRLPGGDAAARDTARCGLALLYQAFGDDFAEHPAARMLVPDDARRAMLCRMIRDNVCCATSSGAGRVFDGVAALLGICQHNHFEAQAGLALEAAAHRAASSRSTGPACRARSWPADEPMFELRTDGQHRVIDLSRLIRLMAESGCAGGVVAGSEQLALLFHETLARALATAALEAAQRSGIRTIGLSGGVFCNVMLTRQITALLEAGGMRVLRHRRVPANDGGLSLGQAAVAAAATVQRRKGA
ncbi:carbamoyltransferase HypF [Fontivita pretiosa]|uniref:carbamoyltransferase HypF n=1 Tax=Fontivita pretiosa TaxID=2989684 RepID=UPI003D169C71